jgi:hypothetical protein
MEEDPLLFNERKRKLLGDEVHDGFLHPKKFKTNSLLLQNESDQSQKMPIKSSADVKKRKLELSDEAMSSKIKKHKFQII